jgi:flagellar L-ring protein precursor FlgH
MFDAQTGGSEMSMRMRTGSRIVVCIVAALFLASAGSPGVGRADSIFNSATNKPSSLYSTTSSEYEPGDIITIMIVENFDASNRTRTDTDKETELDAGFEGFDDIFGLTHIFGRPLSVDPNFVIDVENEFDGSGRSERSSRITGTVTGQVTEVLPNGNLRIEASQRTVINDEKNSVILTGTIRPQDISSQNSILSTQISNAEIRYEGVGPLSTVQKRGIVTEFLEFIWPF